MAKREYRELLEKEHDGVIKDFIEEMVGFLEVNLDEVKEGFINELESAVNDILASAEDINLDDSEEMKSGIESIISDLEELASELY